MWANSCIATKVIVFSSINASLLSLDLIHNTIFSPLLTEYDVYLLFFPDSVILFELNFFINLLTDSSFGYFFLRIAHSLSSLTLIFAIKSAAFCLSGLFLTKYSRLSNRDLTKITSLFLPSIYMYPENDRVHI